jgi:chemotaxis signal transduction protein
MTTADTAAENSFVLLQIGDRRFALPAGLVVELAPPVRLHTFPHASPSIAGVIVRRGHIVPVYDAASALACKPSSAHRFYLIARRRFDKAVEFGAIPVNGECELVTGEMQPLPAEQPAYVAGTLALGDDSLEVLDLEALVTSSSSVAHEPGQAEALS